MTGHPAEEMPCRAGCVVKGSELTDAPARMPATHGAYCERCFGRLAYPLRIAPELAEHITSRIPERGTQLDESMVKSTAEGSPTPFSIAAFNDVNSMYGTLIYLARYFARRLGVPAPTPAAHAWRSAAGHIKGLPANVTPEAARYQTAAVATWLDTRLNEILEVIEPDDLEGFTEQMRTIASASTRHEMKMRARYSVMPHQTEHCAAGRIAIYPPRRAGDSQLISCEGCGYVFSENYYLQMLADWRLEQLAERRKVNREKREAAKRTADHLAAKYAGDLMLTAAPTSVSAIMRQREYELIRDALAAAAAEVPPAGVLVTHDAGSISVAHSHAVKPGEVVHSYRAGSGHITAPANPIGESS